MQVVIQIPDDIEQKLAERASQLNIPLETFILESLVQLVEPSDPDNTPNEVILEGLREGLQQALSGQTIPLSQMWDGIDAEWPNPSTNCPDPVFSKRSPHPGQTLSPHSQRQRQHLE